MIDADDIAPDALTPDMRLLLAALERRLASSVRRRTPLARQALAALMEHAGGLRVYIVSPQPLMKAAAARLLRAGLSVREVSARTGLEHATVRRLRGRG